MMYQIIIKYENECVSCDLPCIDDICPYARVSYCYCDYCGKLIENDSLAETGGEHYHQICYNELYGIEDEE